MESDGECEVTFVWTGADVSRRIMVHVNSITDAHREDIRPAVLEWIDDRGVAAIGYRVPADLVASYRLVDVTDFPDDVGKDRAGWLRVHQAGMVDPRSAEHLPNPLGASSSVLRGSSARKHPAEARHGAATPPRLLPGPAEGTFGAAWLTLPEGAPAERVLVAFDGEMWRQLDLPALVAARGGVPTAVLLIGSGGPSDRAANLPHPDPAAAAVAGALDAARASGLPVHIGPERTIVSGQSYGGLAAGAVVTGFPQIARAAIVQSGSFWFRADTPVTELRDGESGDVLDSLSSADTSGARIVVTYGTNEGSLATVGAEFARRARDGGAQVVERAYTGGHDYAWWRTALLDGLDALDALAASA